MTPEHAEDLQNLGALTWKMTRVEREKQQLLDVLRAVHRDVDRYADDESEPVRITWETWEQVQAVLKAVQS